MTPITLLDDPKLLLETPTTSPTGVHYLEPADLGTVTIHRHSHSQPQNARDR